MKLGLTLGALLLALALIWLLLLRCRHGSRRMEALGRFLYAHRGYHDRGQGVPENSMAAFRRAVACGWGAELDVHLTKDGRLAVIHDSSLKRTAGADATVEALTAGELADYRLEGTEERIPLLEEVLPLFDGVAPLIIELKTEAGNHRSLCRALWKLLEGYGGAYCIESFDPRAVRWFRRRQPQVLRGQLSCNMRKSGSDLHPAFNFALTNLLTNWFAVPDFIAYDHTQRRNLGRWLSCHIWGAQEVSWTVRQAQDQQRLEAEGCMIIFEGYDPRKMI